MSERTSPNEIALRAHPPERRRRVPLYVACGGSSCCCCCCLHSAGGLVGAIVGGVRGARPRAGVEHDGSRRTAIMFFWVALVLVCAAVPGGSLQAGEREVEEWLFFGILLGLPLLELGAVLLALIGVLVAPASMIPQKKEAARAVGSIALWTLLGTIAGILLMVICGPMVIQGLR